MCAQRRRCASENSDCPYQIVYLSNGTSSTGILVEDVLHLTTEDAKSENVEARVTFGQVVLPPSTLIIHKFQLVFRICAYFCFPDFLLQLWQGSDWYVSARRSPQWSNRARYRGYSRS